MAKAKAAAKGFKTFTKRLAFGSAIGFVASRSTSSSAEAGVNSRVGAVVGGLTAAVSPILAKKVITATKRSAPVFKARVRARQGKFIFRRIKGRLVPIKVK